MCSIIEIYSYLLKQPFPSAICIFVFIYILKSSERKWENRVIVPSMILTPAFATLKSKIKIDLDLLYCFSSVMLYDWFKKQVDML